MDLSLIRGCSLRLKYNRMAQTYVVPIALSDEITPEVVTFGTVAPTLAYLALKRLVIDPYLAREAALARAAARRMNYAAVAERKREAMSAVQLMQQTVTRRIAAEEAVNGLVVLSALYGQLIVSGPVIEDDVSLVVDVTIPVQCLVKGSQLRIQEGTKARLLGFYDPCPDEDKQLKVRYRCMGRVHEVTIDDQDALIAPQRRHIVT